MTLYVFGSFYIHCSIFTQSVDTSWRLEACNINSSIYPLLTLIKMLEIKPSQKVTNLQMLEIKMLQLFMLHL